jgi:hypothetical protein
MQVLYQLSYGPLLRRLAAERWWFRLGLKALPDVQRAYNAGVLLQGVVA